MKLTDGLFHKVFDEIGEAYPTLEKEHWIVDIGAAKLADTPGAFDVVVMPNLYGDVLSDVAAQIAGSVGLAGSANIGDGFAMFEAIHGSAPRRANQNVANPSGLLMGAVQMLVHIGQADVATRVHNAWLATIEEGIHTYDIFKDGTSKQKVGTREFASAVIDRLGTEPQTLKAVRYENRPAASAIAASAGVPRAKKELAGIDVFFDWNGGSASDLAERIRPLTDATMRLTTIANRGTKVWPDGNPDTFCVDQWACRFMPESGAIDHRRVATLLGTLAENGLDFIKTEHLYTFDGESGYSLAQGQ